jgi:hypothetical protein
MLMIVADHNRLPTHSLGLCRREAIHRVIPRGETDQYGLGVLPPFELVKQLFHDVHAGSRAS